MTSATNRPPAYTWILAAGTSLLTTLLCSAPASACSACYGDPDAEMSKGALAGVMVLGAIVYGVLMGMVTIGATWFIRARRLQNATAG